MSWHECLAVTDFNNCCFLNNFYAQLFFYSNYTLFDLCIIIHNYWKIYYKTDFLFIGTTDSVVRKWILLIGLKITLKLERFKILVIYILTVGKVGEQRICRKIIFDWGHSGSSRSLKKIFTALSIIEDLKSLLIDTGFK